MWSLGFLVIQALSQTCPMYNCHVGGFDMSPTCARLTSAGNIQLQICDKTGLSYCDVTGTITKNYTCTGSPPQSPYVAYPGEFCIDDSDCVTGTCTSNVCVGQLAGSQCNSNSDCDVGLYCNPGFFCAPQKTYLQPCTNDYQCGNSMGCNNTLFEDGVCIEYYSIPNGQIVGSCIDMLQESISNLCQSGSCTLLNNYTDTVGVCSPPYTTLSKNFPIVCEQDSDCYGYNGINVTTGTCSCGMDMYGRAYCNAFSGDPPTSTLTQLAQIHVLSSSINLCHTQRRFDKSCLQQDLGPAKTQLYLNVRAEATDTARYQSNDFCTKSIFNGRYFGIGPADFGCQAYGCLDPFSSWTGIGTCLTFVEGVNGFAINPCNTSSTFPYCDYTKSQNNKWRNVTCGPVPSPALLYPGDPCTNGQQCISGSCSNFTCRGVRAGGICVSSQDCIVGYYCVSSGYIFTCQPLIQAYQYGCGSDFDCVNNCGCNFGSSGPPGQCIPYFSLGYGQSVPCSSSSLSYLCASGACYYQNSGYVGVCTPTPRSIASLPTSCTFSGQCTGTNRLGYSFQGTCTCGFNPSATSYCTPFLGDPAGVTYLNTMFQYFTQNPNINSCQTTRRFSPDCFSLGSQGLNYNYNKVYQDYLYFTLYPYLINNDPCVKATYTFTYWNLTQPTPPTPPVPQPKPTPVPRPPNTSSGNYLCLIAAAFIATII
jgi:hypothetical protein